VILKRSLMVALCACLVGACTKPQQELRFAHEISPLPPRVGRVTLTLQITDLSGAAVTGAQITVEGNMSHAGMAPIFAEAKEVEPGRYRSIMELSMAGDWNVTVHVTWSSNRKIDHTFEISGVEP
jgi:hypothetical protein